MTLDLDAIRERAEHWHVKSGPITNTPEEWAARPCDDDCPGCAIDALVGRIQELTQERDALVVSAATVVPAHMTLTSDEQTAAKRIDQLNAMVACESDWVEHWEARAVKAEAELAETESALCALSDELERAEEVRGEAEARATRLLEAWEKAEARLVLAEKARRAEQVRANKAEAERDEMQKRLDFHFGHAVESWKEEVASLEAERDTLREECAYQTERAAILSSAVGLARLSLDKEQPSDAKKTLDDAAAKTGELLRAALTRGAGDE